MCGLVQNLKIIIFKSYSPEIKNKKNPQRTCQHLSNVIRTKSQRVWASQTNINQCVRPKGVYCFDVITHNSHCGWNMKLLFCV